MVYLFSPLFIYYKCTKDDRNLISKIVLFIALGYAFESLNSLKELLIRGRSRLTGSLGNPNELGAYLSIFWIVVWASLYLVKEKVWLKRFLQVVLIVGILCSLRTLSRGSYLTLLTTFLVFVFYRYKRAFILALTASVMIISFYSVLLPDFMVKRINETFEKSDSDLYSGEEKIVLQRESAGSRVLFWKTGLLMFADNPLLGVGFTQFPSWLPVYGAQYGLKIERPSHNMYVKMLSEQGIIGFTIFILLLIRAYRAGSHLMTSQDIFLQRMGVSMCVIVAGFGVSMLFGDRFFQGALVGTFFILCGIVKAGIYDMSIRKDEQKKGRVIYRMYKGNLKILFISNFFPPETGAGSIRVEELARRWSSNGHKVTILTGYPNYPRYEIYEGYKNRLISYEKWNGLDVIRTYTYVPRKATIIQRLFGQVMFMICGILGGLFATKPDIIVASSPPFSVGFTAFVLSIIRRRPFIFDVRDPYPEAPIELGVITNPVLIFILRKIERMFYNSATAVVTVTQGFKDILVRNGCPCGKCYVVPNGVNVNFFQKLPSQDRNSILLKFGLQDKFNVVYTGTLGRVHNLKIMIEAGSRLKEDEGIRFVIAGEGAKRQEIEKMIAELQLKNFVIMNSIPKDDVRELLSVADIGFQALEDIDYIAGAHAVKIFEYMAMGLPVIFSGRGESKMLIENADCGICCGQNDLEGVINAINTLKENPDLRKRYGMNGRLYVERNFDRGMLADSFLSIIKNCGR